MDWKNNSIIRSISNKFNQFWSSFNNGHSGFSGKKLTAFFAAITGICFPNILWSLSCFQSGHWDNILAVLGANTSLITALFAVNTYDKKVNPASETTRTTNATATETSQ